MSKLRGRKKGKVNKHWFKAKANRQRRLEYRRIAEWMKMHSQSEGIDERNRK